MVVFPRISGSDEATLRIRSWIRGQHHEKAITVTSSDAVSTSPEIGKTPSVAPMSPVTEHSVHHEMEDTQLAELDGKLCSRDSARRAPLLTFADTSPPAELHDTGLSPIEVIQKHSNFGRDKTRSPTNPSRGSFSFTDNTSFVSRTSGAANSARVDSPLLGHSTPLLGIARSHVGDSVPGGQMQTMYEGNEQIISPATVSPPTAGEVTADDYISAGEVVNSRKRSVFHENEEDLGRLN